MMTTDDKIQAFRKEFKIFSDGLKGEKNNLQSVHTPFALCHEIVGKLHEYTSFEGKTFCCLNLEFVETLMIDFSVPSNKIWFVTDCKKKAMIAKEHSRYNGVNVVCKNFLNWRIKMKFDCMIGNPPYQNGSDDKSAVSSQLWDKFVIKSLSGCKTNCIDGGYLVLVHPSPWRKPGSDLYKIMTKRQLKWLDIHGQTDGIAHFDCATRYDWYVLQNKDNQGAKTQIKDENGKVAWINLSDWDFLPNCHYNSVEKLLAKNNDARCEVIYDRAAYGADKQWISNIETAEYKHPCVHMMTKGTPLKLFYSNTTNHGHFGVSKVIINLTGATLCCFVDDKGEYGMTQWMFGIKIVSKLEGEQIKQALMSDEFKKIWQATQWLSMTREWRIFQSFKKDFWKAFV